MSPEEVASIAKREIVNPTLAVTRQYLEIHQPVIKDGEIVVDRVDLEGPDHIGIVYIPVIDQSFHFAIYVNLDNAEVQGFGTESRNRVSFKASSKALALDHLKAFTSLIPTKCWDKGDHLPSGKISYPFSAFILEPNPEPDEFNDKLNKLLDILECDFEGMMDMIKASEARINVAMNYHNGNSMLGGMSINQEQIKRLSNFNLSIDFDLYAEGNSLRDEK